MPSLSENIPTGYIVPTGYITEVPYIELQGVGVERTLFEPEHELFRESYQKFLAQHVAPNHEKWEEQNIVDRDVWVEAGKQGFLGTAVPEEFGGGGVKDFRYNAIITEETTKGGFSGIGFTLHNDVVAPYLLELTNEEQKQRWLPGFASGELISAIAMTEPGTGSDLQGIKTKAVRDGDHWVLNGSKTFITNGINADIIIVVACTDPDKGAQGFSLLVVERDMPGFERGRNLDKIGMKAQDTARTQLHRRTRSRCQPAGRRGNGLLLLDEEPSPGTTLDRRRCCRRNGIGSREHDPVLP